MSANARSPVSQSLPFRRRIVEQPLLAAAINCRKDCFLIDIKMPLADKRSESCLPANRQANKLSAGSRLPVDPQFTCAKARLDSCEPFEVQNILEQLRIELKAWNRRGFWSVITTHTGRIKFNIYLYNNILKAHLPGILAGSIVSVQVVRVSSSAKSFITK